MGKLNSLKKGISDVFIDMQQSGAIIKQIEKGYTPPTGTDALKDGMFSSALKIARNTKSGQIFVPDVNTKQVRQALTDDQIELLDGINLTRKQKIINEEKAFKETPEYKKDNTIAEPEALKTLREQYNRTSTMIKDGGFERDQFLTERVSDYYGDKKYGTHRKVAAAGAIGAVGLGARLASGGNLTHNGNGDKDIIGIPFI